MTITNVTNLEIKYPHYKRDRDKYMINIIVESLNWRIYHREGSKFVPRPETIQKYLPYIPKKGPDMNGVKKNIRQWFGNNKHDPVFHEYYNIPELAYIFRNEINFNPLEFIDQQESESILVQEEEQQELPLSSLTVTVKENNDKPIIGEIAMKFDKEIFKGTISSRKQFHHYMQTYVELSRCYL